jgi:hypothetical protein
MRGSVSAVACMRLLDGVIFSARHVVRAVLDGPRPPVMPPATGFTRGQAVHHGRHRFDLALPPPAADALSFSRNLQTVPAI